MRKLILPIFLSIGIGYSFTGDNHEMLTKTAYYQGLRENKLEKITDLVGNVQGGEDALILGSSEPDAIPLTDLEMVSYSGLAGYNFSQWVYAKFPTLIDMFVNVNALPFGETIYANMEDAFRSRFGKEESTLRRSTQHTYVDGGEANDDVTQLFGEITVSPYAAQAEFNMAISALNGKSFKNATVTEKLEALRRLGRTLHYVQDITTPSSCELRGNFHDLFTMISEGLGDGSYYQNLFERDYVETNFSFNMDKKELQRLNSADFFERYVPKAWEKQIERVKGLKPVLPATKRCEEILKANGYSVPFGYIEIDLLEMVPSAQALEAPFSFEKLPDFTVEQKIKSLRNEIFQSRLIEFCDGLRRYAPLFYEKVFAQTNVEGNWTSWFFLARYKIYKMFYPQFLTADKADRFWTAQYVEMVGANDNLEYTADVVVPMAVKNSTAVIELFFEKTDGIRRGGIDMTPINMLLLD